MRPGPLYCWHVFWQQDLGDGIAARPFYWDPTEVWAINACDAVRVAMQEAWEIDGVEPNEMPCILSVLEVIDPPQFTKGGNDGAKGR